MTDTRIYTAKVSGTFTATTHRAFADANRPHVAWTACGAEGRRMPKSLVKVNAPVNCPRCGA